MVRASAWSISSPVHHPFMATTSAPRPVAAQKAMIHSGQLAAAMATRSPRPMPNRLAMRPMTDATRPCNWANVTRRPSENT